MITGPQQTVNRARKLRSEMSLPETLLWRELRERPGGYKFRRQHPAGEYVLDFFCAATKLAVEIDGRAHDSADAARHDNARSHYLRSQGIATTRIPAHAVLSDRESVVLRLVQICSARTTELALKVDVPLHHLADGPPPRAGEDVS
ncbi:Leucine--tRNA ligase [Alteripontixanthobacter maritimus]|uniref:Leucine--tRNA ligase n=1 Tax=Alteripontixanthobacter maritimus TaxID=2161824 RepID=A0A369Q275_9SPHN|nr:endonuclease domain-containing protein [Alteripontixanthobacter maritimus]RDC59011.1 Leucine--tRNA ligase [Alteripontixanthobacter maritimus]